MWRRAWEIAKPIIHLTWVAWLVLFAWASWAVVFSGTGDDADMLWALVFTILLAMEWQELWRR